jgi:purine-binding chemotaxis protein CheW
MSNNINGANTANEKLNSQITALRGQNFQVDANGEIAEINYPYVIFQLFENRFAVNCKYVVSIEKVSKTTEIANTSQEFRGISYFKNEPISIFDLRRLFGLMSNDDYINNVVNLPQRIIDHENYARTLRECVDSRTPFEFNTDPRKCAFGKWFYNYLAKAKTNIEIHKELQKIEPFHDKFHDTARIVKDCISRGKFEEAAGYLDEVDKLKEYIARELSRLNEMISRGVTELTVILQVKDKKIGLIVDSAESVENIDEIQDLPPSVVMTNYIKRLGLSQKERQIIFILEAAEFNKT